MISLAARCRQNFEARVALRGQQYFAMGAITLDVADEDGASFLVRGSDKTPYEVEIKWEGSAPASIQAHCTCPYFKGEGLCKHLWGVLLKCDQMGLAHHVPGKGPLEVEINDSDYADDDDVWDEMRDSRQQLTQPRSHHAGKTSRGLSASPPANWRTSFQQLREQLWQETASTTGKAQPSELPLEAWYVLDLDAVRRWGLPVITFHQRTNTKSGNPGKVKKAAVCRAEVARFTLQEDRQLMEMLIGVDSHILDNLHSSWATSDYRNESYSRHSHGTITPLMFSELLPRLCATGRFVCVQNTAGKQDIENAPKLSWDAGPAWKARLRVQNETSDKMFHFTGEFYRGNEVMPLDVPLLLIKAGLMVLRNSIALLDGEDHFEWLAWLRKFPNYKIPQKDESDFISHLWSMPNLPPLELPTTMKWEQIREAPRGSIRITRAKNSSAFMDDLYGNVTFHYGDKVATYSEPQAAIVDETNRRVIIRDQNRERQLIEQLSTAGFTPPRNHYYHKPEGDFGLSAKKLMLAVEKLIANGWDVEAEGQLVRRPGNMTMRVSSNMDWFELTGEFDFDGVTATLPTLLAAMSRGEKYIQLGDGTKGMLPETWLKKFGNLVGLGTLEESEDAIKFAPSQAMLLDALLAAQEQDDVKVDQRFNAYRQKLRSFEGVAAAKAPSTFKGELRHYQEEGLGWLHFLREYNLGGCLADDMGLGKTIQVLAMLDARRTRRMATGETRAPSLVVVPRSLVFNWIEEAERFAPKLRLLNYSHGQRGELQEQLSDYDVVVTTYGILRRDIAHLKDTRFDYAILDEAQAVKNENSLSAKACRLIQADHRLAMTGTPVENHLGELWSLFEFLNPGMLGRSAMFNSFVKSTTARLPESIATNTDSGGEGSEAVASPHAVSVSVAAAEQASRHSLTVLANAMRPFILRRTKKQVLTELPERTEQTLYCEMDSKQRKYYEDLRDYYRKTLTQRVEKSGLAKSKIHVLEALLRLRQAACHPGLITDLKKGEPSAKLETLLEQLDELVSENHKALIFSQFTSLLDIVRTALDERKLKYEYLDGKTKDRKAPVERFQNDPECPLFLISLKAGGQGLNLTAADYVFILDPWWNPAVEAQAIDRAYRIGQTRPVFAYRLICKGTVEDKILELQKSKRELAEAIINADNSLIRSLTTEDLQMLLS